MLRPQNLWHQSEMRKYSFSLVSNLSKLEWRSIARLCSKISFIRKMMKLNITTYMHTQKISRLGYFCWSIRNLIVPDWGLIDYKIVSWSARIILLPSAASFRRRTEERSPNLDLTKTLDAEHQKEYDRIIIFLFLFGMAENLLLAIHMTERKVPKERITRESILYLN